MSGGFIREGEGVPPFESYPISRTRSIFTLFLIHAHCVGLGVPMIFKNATSLDVREMELIQFSLP